MEEPKAEIQVEAQAVTKKKKRRSGCGCLVIAVLALAVLMLLLSAPPPPPEETAKLGPAALEILAKAQKVPAAATPARPAQAVPSPAATQPAAVPAVPEVPAAPVKPATLAVEEGPLPKYSVKVDQDKPGTKLVLDVALDVDLDKLPNEQTLETLSRSIFKEKGGDRYPRVFLVYSLPKLDPMPVGYWARVEFTPECKVSISGATQDEGKWIVSQRGKAWSGPGTVLGRWYFIGVDAEIITLVKEGEDYFEYTSFPGETESLKQARTCQTLDGVMRFKSDHPNDAKNYWCIDAEGRWCMYRDGKLANVELPLERTKTD